MHDAGCGAALTTSECDQFLSDIQAEATVREAEHSNLKWWPVLSFGFSMRW